VSKKPTDLEDNIKYDMLAIRQAKENIDLHLDEIDQILYRLLHLDDPVVREDYHFLYDLLKESKEARRQEDDLWDHELDVGIF
jgi:hypothetical protein